MFQKVPQNWMYGFTIKTQVKIENVKIKIVSTMFPNKQWVNELTVANNTTSLLYRHSSKCETKWNLFFTKLVSDDLCTIMPKAVGVLLSKMPPQSLMIFCKHSSKIHKEFGWRLFMLSNNSKLETWEWKVVSLQRVDVRNACLFFFVWENRQVLKLTAHAVLVNQWV
jgi:hypothetical protein